VVVSVIAVLLFVAAGAALLGASQAPTAPPLEPQVSLANFELIDERSCGQFGIGGLVFLTFDLPENNNVDAIVLVKFCRDGVEVGRDTYEVAARTIRQVSRAFFSDCDDHYFEARIVSVVRG
jgi:hypothetical protein